MRVNKNSTKFDVIIIGGGAAGLSAALWCDELGLSALLLEAGAEFGGQLLRTYNEIRNHLGTKAANGRELRDRFLEQTEKRRFEFRLNAKVAEIDLKKKSVGLENGEVFFAGALIIASGVSRRKLNVEGEETFENRGVIESGKRDARLAEGRSALVVGGGDAAFENALILSETASLVTLLYRGKHFRARREFVEKAEKHPKIKILTETIVREISGREKVEAVKLENLQTGEIYDYPVEAVLIRIGVEPNTKFLSGKLDLDVNGYIKISQTCETSAVGVFAVGDVANPLAPTVSSAVGMGATAVKTITNYELKEIIFFNS
ncbi:MAG TPA: FAD-dependent oxidoreductase [Pyrinomonadaceae bacterium]